MTTSTTGLPISLLSDVRDAGKRPGSCRIRPVCRPKDSGFTLIEILISLVIVSVGLVAILSAFQISLQALGGTRDALVANMLACEKFSELRGFVAGHPGSAPMASGGKYSHPFGAYQWEEKVVLIPLSPREGMTPTGALYEVTVEVWRSGSAKRYLAATLIWTAPRQTAAP